MTREEFQRIGIRMYGRKHWRREYSVNLGLDPSTVWRISTRETGVPPVVEVAVKSLLEKHKQLTIAARELKERTARQKRTYHKSKLTFRKTKRKKPKFLMTYQREEQAHGALAGPCTTEGRANVEEEAGDELSQPPADLV